MRRACTHEAKVWQFTPNSAANFFALTPLFANSSTNAARRTLDVRTRPKASLWSTSSGKVVFVISHTLPRIWPAQIGAPARTLTKRGGKMTVIGIASQPVSFRLLYLLATD